MGRLVAGRYEVVRKLAEGGVGAVYLAMQRPLDRPVALKVLLKKYADDETALKRFEKEAAAVARLAHAHIVVLYDFGATETGDLYIAMEFLRGQSLRELLDATSFIPWERSLHIVRGICSALVAAHTQKIVHRDLKPENVMLVESNGDMDFAKVLDFGLARSIQSNVPAITRHDVIPGTPVYMSPERAHGISNDPRSDLYSLGALWFELLCGEPPFPGEVSIKIIVRHLHEVPRRPSTVQRANPIPDFIDALVLELLEKQVEDRPPSARALLERLDVLARPQGWHVGRAHDVGRRAFHDSELQSFALAAADLGAGDDLRFSIEEIEPLTLVNKKAQPLTLTAEPPLLLTNRKKGSAPTSSPPTNPFDADFSHFPDQHASVASSPDTLPHRWTPAPSPSSAPSASPLPADPSGAQQPRDLPHRSAGHEHVHLVPPPRIDTLAQVAGWLSSAKTARSVGELCCAFLVTRFDRALVIDMRGSIPLPLASVTSSGALLAMPPIVYALPDCQGILELATRREAYYGPPLVTADWMPWFGSLGGPVPGAMFVGGLQREGQLAFLFYADHRDLALRPTVKDTVGLLREAAGSLSVIT